MCVRSEAEARQGWVDISETPFRPHVVPYAAFVRSPPLQDFVRSQSYTHAQQWLDHIHPRRHTLAEKKRQKKHTNTHIPQTEADVRLSYPSFLANFEYVFSLWHTREQGACTASSWATAAGDVDPSHSPGSPEAVCRINDASVALQASVGHPFATPLVTHTKLLQTLCQ